MAGTRTSGGASRRDPRQPSSPKPPLLQSRRSLAAGTSYSLPLFFCAGPAPPRIKLQQRLEPQRHRDTENQIKLSPRRHKDTKNCWLRASRAKFLFAASCLRVFVVILSGSLCLCASVVNRAHVRRGSHRFGWVFDFICALAPGLSAEGFGPQAGAPPR